MEKDEELPETIKYEVEMSGMSDSYEEACQEMLQAGYEYLLAHPDSELKGSRPTGMIKDVKIDTFGMFDPENEETEQLSEVVINAVDDCTGAMEHAVMNHLLYISKHGLEGWWKKAKEKGQTYKRDEGGTPRFGGLPLASWDSPEEES